MTYNNAGKAAHFAIVRYGVAIMSAITKAVAPITGGISSPPVPPTAKSAALNLGGNFASTIIGFNKAPTVAVFPGPLPLIMPKRPAAITVALPAPPKELRVKYLAHAAKRVPAGVAAKNHQIT